MSVVLGAKDTTTLIAFNTSDPNATDPIYSEEAEIYWCMPVTAA
jgi:hypothetical protein